MTEVSEVPHLADRQPPAWLESKRDPEFGFYPAKVAELTRVQNWIKNATADEWRVGIGSFTLPADVIGEMPIGERAAFCALPAFEETAAAARAPEEMLKSRKNDLTIYLAILDKQIPDTMRLIREDVERLDLDPSRILPNFIRHRPHYSRGHGKEWHVDHMLMGANPRAIRYFIGSFDPTWTTASETHIGESTKTENDPYDLSGRPRKNFAVTKAKLPDASDFLSSKIRLNTPPSEWHDSLPIYQARPYEVARMGLIDHHVPPYCLKGEAILPPTPRTIVVVETY